MRDGGGRVPTHSTLLCIQSPTNRVGCCMHHFSWLGSPAVASPFNQLIIYQKTTISPRALCFHLSVPFLHPVRCWKSRSAHADVNVEMKGVHSHFEDVKLEPNPAYGEVTLSQPQTEPQPYEEFVAKGGVNSDNVAMEENPCL